jgi:hypothetical protein
MDRVTMGEDSKTSCPRRSLRRAGGCFSAYPKKAFLLSSHL